MEAVPKYLQKRRRQWYAVLDVPVSLRGFFGKSRFKQSLRTDSLREAERLVGPVVALWQRQIDAVRAEDPHDRNLAIFRQAYELCGSDWDAQEAVKDQIILYAEKLEETTDYPTAKCFYDKATGRRLDFNRLSEEWLTSLTSKPKTKTMHRQAIKLLQNRHRDIEDIGRREASRFIAEVLSVDRKAETVNRMLSTYSTFWQWLEDRGYREGLDNPWTRQRVPTVTASGRERGGEEKRRPFTEDEGAKLIEAVDATASKYPADPLVVRILAATGMRIEEVCSLYLEDVEDSGTDYIVLRVVDGKTKAARRDVPLADPTTASMLRSYLAAIPLEASKDSPVFPDFKPDANGNRYGAVSKRLSRRLRSFSEAPDLAPAHSWRHRAKGLLERAGLRQVTQELYLGHELSSFGHRNYYTGSIEELVEAARALHLPPIPAQRYNPETRDG